MLQIRILVFKSSSLLIIPSLLLLLGGCASVSSNSPTKVTVSQIIEMTKAGASDQEIINEIQQSKTVYKLDGNQYARLRQIGVSDNVVNYMQETYTDEIQKRQDRDEDWESWDIEDAGY